jgi:hypothetical protein
MKLTTLRLKKHFGNNVAGEIASFTPEIAEHILKHSGGERLADFDDSTHRFDLATGKAVEKTTRAKA